MKFMPRTDLAVEAREMYRENAEEKSEVPGVEVEERDGDGIHITRVKVSTREGEQAMGKPCGTYITLEIPGLYNGGVEAYENACHELCRELRSLGLIKEDTVTLVVGLGNRGITADALGPKAVDGLMITRHLFEHIPDMLDDAIESVCALAPGVLGITGVETVEIVKGVCEHVKPELVIAIDALAARKLERINNTIQISDTGINPGSGVENSRKALDRNTLGVPVIAVGVPTVVDAVSVASDTVAALGRAITQKTEIKSELLSTINGMNDDEKYALVREILSDGYKNMTVTSKDVDFVMDKMSKVIANGINLALHDMLTLSDVQSFVE